MRVSTLIIPIVLVIAACGGSSDEPATDNGTDAPEVAQGETDQPVPDDADGADATPPPAADDDPDASEGSGPSTATVTLGDDTYSFSTEGAVVAQCLTDLFGIFSVQLPLVDAGGAAGDGSVQIVALHEGTDPETVGEVDSVEVSVGDDTWIADEVDMVVEQTEALEPGMSQVDSVEIDGSTVRGSATFVRQGSLFGGGEIETTTGTFEATCGEERTA